MSIESYYEDAASGIVIYHGDALEVLPMLPPVDVVLTDPPFYLPAHISTGRRKWPRSLASLNVMESYFRVAFAAMRERLKPTGALYTFCDSTSYAVFLSLLYPLFDRTQSIVWDKSHIGLGNGWRHTHELIAHGALSGTGYADGMRVDVLKCPVVPSAERHHPSEKPVGLLKALLAAHPPGMVIDPYMGSGSVLAAAKEAGWSAIGIELEHDMCEIAARRLAQEVLPLEAAG